MAPAANRIPLAEPITSGVSSRRRLQNREAQQRFRERAAHRAEVKSRKSSSTSPAATDQPSLPVVSGLTTDPQPSDPSREMFEQDPYSPYPTTSFISPSMDSDPALGMHELSNFDAAFWDTSIADLLVAPFSHLPSSLTDDPIISTHSSPEYEATAFVDHSTYHDVADAASAGLLDHSMYTQLGADHSSMDSLPPGGSQVPVMFAQPDVTWSSVPSSVRMSQSAPGSLGSRTADSLQTALSHSGIRTFRMQPPPPPSPTSPQLHIAAHSPEHSVMRVIMRRQPSSGDSRDDRVRMPVHVAVELGDDIAVSLLLRHGTDPHVRDSDGVGVLQYAVQSGDYSLVDMLMEPA